MIKLKLMLLKNYFNYKNSIYHKIKNYISIIQHIIIIIIDLTGKLLAVILLACILYDIHKNKI